MSIEEREFRIQNSEFRREGRIQRRDRTRMIQMQRIGRIIEKVVGGEKKWERRIERPTFNPDKSGSNRRNIEYRMQRRKENVKSVKSREKKNTRLISGANGNIRCRRSNI